MQNSDHTHIKKRSVTSIAMLMALVLSVHASEAEPGTPSRIDKIVGDLGSTSQAIRNAAEKAFANLTEAAVPAVEKAFLNTKLPTETRKKLLRLLPEFRRKYALAVSRYNHERYVRDHIRITTMAYEKVGKRRRIWDRAAREALYQTVLWLSKSTALFQVKTNLHRQLQSARKAGCNDPLVLYVHARIARIIGEPVYTKKQVLQLHALAHTHMAASRYPPVRKAFAHIWYADQLIKSEQPLSDATSKKVDDLIAMSLKAMGEAAGDPKHHIRILKLIGNNVIYVLRELDPDRGPAVDEVYKAMNEGYAKAVGTKPQEHACVAALLIKGRHYVDYAWDARGSGYAHTVSEEGWRLFKKRARIAQNAFKRAWELRPDLSEPATRMITVAMAVQPERAYMEKWFKRAMDADPLNWDACSRKVNFLAPRWHGSEEDLLTFGRSCFKNGDWDGPVPVVPSVLFDVHKWLADNVLRETQDESQYWKRPAVWKELKPAFEVLFEKKPAYTWARSLYAKVAYFNQDWDACYVQLNILKDKPHRYIFKNMNVYQRIFQEVKANATPAAKALYAKAATRVEDAKRERSEYVKKRNESYRLTPDQLKPKSVSRPAVADKKPPKADTSKKAALSPEQIAEKKAKSLYFMAMSYRKNRLYKNSNDTLKKIVKLYPTSSYAKSAQRLLDKSSK